MSNPDCPCCGQALEAGLATWHRQCPACGYEGAQLAIAINATEAHQRVDEAVREQALHDLRHENFEQLLDIIDRARTLTAADGERPKLLDVGAGYGWFVWQAATRFTAEGIEPDAGARAVAARAGVVLRDGFFPQCLEPDERFDVISFNDSIEHFDDPAGALAVAAGRLRPRGVLALNLPDAQGALYRLARLLRRLGVSGPFDRMWQVGMPSPHRHYFNRGNLSRLAGRLGLETVAVDALQSLRLKGLYARIAYARPHAAVTSGLLWLGMLPLLAALRWLHGDIMVLVLVLRPGPPARNAADSGDGALAG